MFRIRIDTEPDPDIIIPDPDIIIPDPDIIIPDPDPAKDKRADKC